MTSVEYWEKRAIELEEILHKSAYGTSEAIEAVFQRCKKELEKVISLWYTRFAKNNTISLADAKRLLDADELEELQWAVQEYIRYAKDNALNGQWTKQLENASAKVHISRLESILLQTRHLIEATVAKEHDILKKAMEDWYTESYYRNWYNFEIGTGTTMDVPVIDKGKLDKILEKPWAADGKDFSSRIWSQRDKLVQELQQQMTRNCILGKNPKEAIDAISEKFDVTKKQAGNLVMTEEAAMSSRAQEDAYKYLGIRKYVFICTLDEKTCTVCGDMDGREFEMTDRKIGLNANPLHPRCRCTTAPAGAKIHERAARNDDGNTVMVENMTYNEWKKKRLKKAEEGVKKDVKIPPTNDSIGKTYQQEKIPMDYMSRFTPKYSDQTKFTSGTVQMNVKKVSNSNFNMYTDIEATRKDKAVRFIEKEMLDIQEKLPHQFQIPKIAVVNFDKHNLNPYAIGGYDKTTNIVYFNSKYDTKEKVLEYVNRIPGQFANTTESAPILHELGHKFYEDCIKRLAISENMSYNESKKMIDRRIYDYIEDKHDPDFIKNNLSLYANRGLLSGNPTEIIAECFSVRELNFISDEILALLS